jgi:hypothetical protein
MSDCPLVKLATYRKLLKTFEQTGQVTIHISDWLRFFEALAHIRRDAHPPEIYCAIAGEHLIFSRTPFKRGS